MIENNKSRHIRQADQKHILYSAGQVYIWLEPPHLCRAYSIQRAIITIIVL